MSRFDGTTEPLSYGQALAELAKATNFPSEAHRADVVKAIHVEHGLYVVPQEEIRANEIERLRRMVAEREAAESEAREASELRELREQLGLDPDSGLPVVGVTPTDVGDAVRPTPVTVDPAQV